LQGAHLLLRCPFSRDILLRPENADRFPIDLFDVRSQANPVLLATGGANHDVERETGSVSYRFAAQLLHLDKRSGVVELQRVFAVDHRPPRNSEQIVNRVGPGQVPGRQIAFPDTDFSQPRDTVIHLAELNVRSDLLAQLILFLQNRR